jgi:MFS family permease
MINTRRLFICSCIALVTSAFTFSIHGDILQEMGKAFGFDQTQNGSLGLGRFWGMAASMLIGGFICDYLGVKRVLFVALGCHLVGAAGIVFAKSILGASVTPDTAQYWLLAFFFILGCGNGMTEVGINPLVATLYPNDKTHFLNILHAWWPGGLIIGGLLAVFVRNVVFGGEAGVQSQSATLLFGSIPLWQASLMLIFVPAFIYGFILIGSEFPVTERVESGVSTMEMCKEAIRPAFLFWAFCMLLTASTELGPQNWQNSVMASKLSVPYAGTLILVYTSGLMFVLRHFAGPLAHRISPIGILTVSAILSFIGLYLLSLATTVVTAFAFATIFGLGIAYFWPTMLGVTSERFPKGGALTLSLMGTAGNISVGLSIFVMGGIVDHYNVQSVEKDDPVLGKSVFMYDKEGKPVALDEAKINQIEKGTPASEVVQRAKQEGFSEAFRWVAKYVTLPLIFIFAAIGLMNRMRGGYRAIHIHEAMGKMATPE